MSVLPSLRSAEQIAGDLITGITSRLPFKVDLHVGSVIAQIIEGVKQTTFRSYAAVIQMADALSVDRAVGEALQRLANDRNVPIFPAIPSTGLVNITDLTFSKLSSTVYTGQPAPVAGTITVYVTDASLWAPTGTIYVGRGTPNYEGPLQYTGLTSQGNGAYWQVTLSTTSPTTRFHNVGETVVVGQGGTRTINAGATVQTQQSVSVLSVSFSTISPALIPDGEVTVSNVPVICQQAGPVGNVSSAAISQSLGLAFKASVTNTQPFSNGRAADTDDQIRDRIKAYEQAKGKGTAIAIQTAAADVTSPDDLHRVVSANTVTYADGSAALVYDDGAGNEEPFQGIGIEQVVDVAVGGEQDLQLRNKPIAQARVRSSMPGPYNIPTGYQLSCTVDTTTTVHTFSSTDFRVPAAGTAAEVAASINGDPNLNFLGTTAGGGQYVVLFPRSPVASNVQINQLGATDANSLLGFSTVRQYTLNLYRNFLPLYETGLFAILYSNTQAQWSTGILAGDTLIYQVDGTPAITATITTQAFQNIVSTSTLSALAPLPLWAAVLTSLMPGVTVTVVGEVLAFTSNKGASSLASVQLVGGTLLAKMFPSSLSATGVTSGYTLNRQTAQLELATPCQSGDNVTVGSPFTRANDVTVSLPGGPTVEGRVWVVVDGAASMVPNGLQATTQIRFSTTSGSRVITVSGQDGTSFAAQGFGSVQPGDWMLVWGSAGDSSVLLANQLMLRVQTVQVGQLTVSGDPAGSTATTSWFSPPIDRIVFVRSAAPMQRLDFAAQDLDTFAAYVTTKVSGVATDIVGDTVRISTLTAVPGGELLFAAADQGGQTLGLTIGSPIENLPSFLATTATSDSEAGYPNFTWSQFTGFTDASDLIDAAYGYRTQGVDQYDMVEVLDKNVASPQEILFESSRRRRVLVTGYNTSNSTVSMLVPPYMLSGVSGVDSAFNAVHPTMQVGTRYFLRSPYQFDSQDTLSCTIDGQQLSQSYSVPVARRVAASNHSTPSTQTFSASDLQSSLGLNDPNAFNGFDFSNFKVWRQAQTTLSGGSGYQLLVQSSDFGPTGNRLRVGFLYPTTLTQTSLAAQIGYTEGIDFGITLPVSAAREVVWDGTSGFTTSVTTTGGADSVQYTWQVGTQPSFVSAGVQVGDIAILSPLMQFLPGNEGFQAIVTQVNQTSFTIKRPTGLASSDAVQWDNVDNTNRIVTFTKSTGHGVVAGQQFGTYGTPPITTSVYPFNSGSYTAITVSSTQVTAQAPAAVPGALIGSAQHLNNIVTVSASGHGLYAGNIIKVTGAGSGYDGTYGVYAVPNANQFQYVSPGSGSSTSSGRFDLQCIGPIAGGATATALTRGANSSTVSVTTSAPHGFSIGELVTIASVTVSAWVTNTVYAVGDVVRDPGNNFTYKAILAGLSTVTPSLYPLQWVLSTFDLSGTFAVASTTTSTTFTYQYADGTGSASGTAASCTPNGPVAYLARAIQGAGNLLGFAQVSATCQQVADFITANYPQQLTATVLGGTGSDVIQKSTADETGPSNYLSGSNVEVFHAAGSRNIIIQAGTSAPAGSTITLSSASPYNGSYVVQQNVSVGGGLWNWSVVTSVVGGTDGGTTIAPATFTGYTPYQMCQDGENVVLSTNLGSAPASPQFTMKAPWLTAPAIAEEIRLLTVTADQVTRFWNRLIVTGLSNSASIYNSQYGRQVQITTNTFGSGGSVQVSGGTANAKTLALVGSGSSVNGKLGIMSVPYALRSGLNAGFWLTVQNQVQNYKRIGFGQATTVQLFTNGMSITSSENFILQRSYTPGTQWKVERQGQFVAFIDVTDSSSLYSTSVQEGDWVRIANVLPQLWSSSTAYVIGNKAHDNSGNRYVAVANSTNVALTNPSYWSPYTDWSALTSYTTGQYALYSGRIWTALSNNTGATPAIPSAAWLANEWAASNTGIFQVVRVFRNTFWVQNQNAVDDISLLGSPSNMSFYSYDSVMPGDYLVISGTILGSQNVGQYTVLDDASDGSAAFPTNKRIYTSQVPVASGAPVTLGLSYGSVNVQEADPVFLVKRVFAVGPGPGTMANILVDSPALMDRLTSSGGAYLTAQGKLGFSQAIESGIDGYKAYQGLPKQLNLVLYGDPVNPTTNPGVVAAGANVDQRAAITKAIQLGVAVRTRTGVAPQEVIAQVQASVAGYINQLAAGQPVVLGQVITAAQLVNGVTSAVITFPTFGPGSDQISVSAYERANVINPTTDISVSILGS